MKTKVLLLLLTTMPAFAQIMVLRIVPNKIVYPLNEKGTLTVVLENKDDKPQLGTLEITEEWNIGAKRNLAQQNVELMPRETKTLTIPYHSGSHRYGREVRATVTQNGKTTSSKAEYFNVIDEWWRVNIGPGDGAIDATQSPLLRKTLAYYGLPYKTGRSPWFHSETWEQLAPEIGPFLGYGNMATRWLMQKSSVGGNLAAAQYPDDKLWYNITWMPRRTGQIHRDTRKSHQWGFHHTRFTINNMESSYGFELARRFPHYILRNNRGGFAGYYMHQNVNPMKIAMPDTPSHEWVYLTPNFYRQDVLEWALDDLIAGIKAFHEDGVYFDGRYCVHSGYDHLGNNLEKKFDTRQIIVRNMKLTREKIRAALPQCYIWSNGCDDSNPESELLNDPLSGVLKEIQQVFITSPQNAYHKYRSLMESVLDKRNQLFFPSRQSSIKTRILHLGYLSTFNRKDILETRECWTFSNHVLAIFASVLGHPFAGQVQFRQFKQMMTRFSEFFWHEDIQCLKDGYKKFIADGLREIWYEDTIYKRETPAYTDYYIHLVNTPETEQAIDTVRKDPPEADDIEISAGFLSGQGSNVQAWAIQPYGYEATTLEPIQQKISPKQYGKELIFPLPPFKYYTLLVIRHHH